MTYLLNIIIIIIFFNYYFYAVCCFPDKPDVSLLEFSLMFEHFWII